MTAEILNIPAMEYHAAKAVSNTGITKLLESPAHFKYWLGSPDEQTEAMLIGSAFHCLCLEPDTFQSRYHLMQSSRATKAGKEEAAEALSAGREILTASQHEQALALSGAALADLRLARLLSSPTAQKESSIFWSEEVDGVTIPAKARLDYMDAVKGFGLLVVDFKSSKTAHPQKLRRVIYERGYHRQAWWYQRALRQAGLEPQKFLLAVVEKTPPYIVTLATVDAEAVEQGGEECLKALSTYAECSQTGLWPGYTDQIIDIGLEPWAYRKENGNDAEFAV